MLCSYHNGHRISFPEIKRPGRGINLPTGSSAEVKESVGLCGPSCPVLGVTLPLYYFKECGTFHLHRETRKVKTILIWQLFDR
jgi:hypothetical protein